MENLHTKLNDAMERSKWRKMSRWNWSDSSIDSDAERWIRVVHFWCRIIPVDLDL